MVLLASPSYGMLTIVASIFRAPGIYLVSSHLCTEMAPTVSRHDLPACRKSILQCFWLLRNESTIVFLFRSKLHGQGPQVGGVAGGGLVEVVADQNITLEYLHQAA